MSIHSSKMTNELFHASLNYIFIGQIMGLGESKMGLMGSR